MDTYKIAVVLKERGTTDIAGTLVFGEELPDGWGRILNVVTAEHDSLPIDDGDADLIDRTKNTMLDHLKEKYKNIPELGEDREFYDPSIIIVKKGNETYSDEDIEKLVQTIELNKARLEPSVTVSTYNGVDRIHGQFMADEYVYFSIKESEWNGSETKHLNLEQKLFKLVNEVLTYEIRLSEKLLSIVNKFWACGCHPTLANWHKTNLGQINHDDVFIRLFGKIATLLYKTDNATELVANLTSDISDKFFKKNISIPDSMGNWVNVKFSSNFNFPRIRGVIIGFDGSSVNVARFDCTARSGVPLYVTIDLFSNIAFDTSSIVAPSDANYTLTLDTRFNYILITDVPKVRYAFEPTLRFDTRKGLPLSNAYFGDNIQNNSKMLIHNQTDTKMITQEMSVVGELIKDYLQSYVTEFRAEHYVPHNINGKDDECLKIYATVKNILDHQDMEFTIIDNINPDIEPDKIVIPYKAFKTLPDGLKYEYKKIYDAGVHYTIKLRFIRPDGTKIERTKVYTIDTRIHKTLRPKALLDVYRSRKDKLRIVDDANNPYPKDTLLKIHLTNGDALNTIILNDTYKVTDDDVAKGYAEIDLPVNLAGEATAIVTAKAPHHFDSLETVIKIDLALILPLTDFEIEETSIKDNMDILINTYKYESLYDASPANTFMNVFDIPTWLPNPWTMLIKTGAPTIDINYALEGTDIVYTKTIIQSQLDIKYRRKRTHVIPMFDIDSETLYKWYSTIYKGNMSNESIARFKAIAGNEFIPLIPGKKYITTITTKDFDGTTMNSITYDITPSNNVVMDTVRRPMYTNDLMHISTTEELYDYFNSPVNTTVADIVGLNTVAIYLDDDIVPSPKNVNMLKFTINTDSELVFEDNSLLYNRVIQEDGKYKLFTNEYLNEIVAKERITFAYNKTVEIPDRVDITKSRSKFKNPVLTSLNITPSIDTNINFKNDEYIDIEVGYAFVKRDDYEVEFKIVETVTDDAGVVRTFNKTVTLSEADLEKVNNRFKHVITQVPNTKDVKIDVTATLKLASGEDFVSEHKVIEKSITIPATKAPYFPNVENLDVIQTLNLDIQKEENISYVAGSTIYVKIEVENKRGEYDDRIVFEHTYTTDAQDEARGYLRVPVIGNEVERGVYVVTVVAKEPNKLDSYRFIKTFDFRIKTIKTYDIPVVVGSERIVISKSETEKFTDIDITRIGTYVPRRHFIAKYNVKMWTNVAGEERTDEYLDLKDFTINPEWDSYEVTAVLERYPEVWHDVTVKGTYKPYPYRAASTDNPETEYVEVVRILKDDDFSTDMLISAPKLYKFDRVEILRVNENKEVNLNLVPKDFNIMRVVFPSPNYKDANVSNLVEGLTIGWTFDTTSSTFTYICPKGEEPFAPFINIDTNYTMSEMRLTHNGSETNIPTNTATYAQDIANDIKTRVTTYLRYEDVADIGDLSSYNEHTYTYNLNLVLNNKLYLRFVIKNKDMLKFDPSVASLNEISGADFPYECYIDFEEKDAAEIISKLPRVIDADNLEDTKYKNFTYARTNVEGLVTDSTTNLMDPTNIPLNNQFVADILNAYLSGFQANELNPNVPINIYADLDLSNRRLNLEVGSDLGIDFNFKDELKALDNVSQNGDALILQGHLNWLMNNDLTDWEFLSKYIAQSGSFIQSSTGFLKDFNKNLYKVKGYVLTDKDTGTQVIITSASTDRHIINKLTAAQDTGVMTYTIKPFIYIDSPISITFNPSSLDGADPEDSSVAKTRMVFAHPRLGIWQDSAPLEGGQLRLNGNVCEYMVDAAQFLDNIASMLPNITFPDDPYETRIWYAQIGTQRIECPINSDFEQDIDLFRTNLINAIKEEVTQNGIFSVNIYGRVLKDALRVVKFSFDIENSLTTEVYEVEGDSVIKRDVKSYETHLRFRMPMNNANFIAGRRFYFTGRDVDRFSKTATLFEMTLIKKDNTVEKLQLNTSVEHQVVPGSNRAAVALSPGPGTTWGLMYLIYSGQLKEIKLSLRPSRFAKVRIFGHDNVINGSGYDFKYLQELEIPLYGVSRNISYNSDIIKNEIRKLPNTVVPGDVIIKHTGAPNLARDITLTSSGELNMPDYREDANYETLDSANPGWIDLIIPYTAIPTSRKIHLSGVDAKFNIEAFGPKSDKISERWIFVVKDNIKDEFLHKYDTVSTGVWLSVETAKTEVKHMDRLNVQVIHFKPTSSTSDILLRDVIGTTPAQDNSLITPNVTLEGDLTYRLHWGSSSTQFTTLTKTLDRSISPKIDVTYLESKEVFLIDANDYTCVVGTLDESGGYYNLRPVWWYKEEFPGLRGIDYHMVEGVKMTPKDIEEVYMILKTRYANILRELKLMDDEGNVKYIPFPPFIPKAIDMVVLNRDLTNTTWINDHNIKPLFRFPAMSDIKNYVLPGISNACLNTYKDIKNINLKDMVHVPTYYKRLRHVSATAMTSSGQTIVYSDAPAIRVPLYTGKPSGIYGDGFVDVPGIADYVLGYNIAIHTYSKIMQSLEYKKPTYDTLCIDGVMHLYTQIVPTITPTLKKHLYVGTGKTLTDMYKTLQQALKPSAPIDQICNILRLEERSFFNGPEISIFFNAIHSKVDSVVDPIDVGLKCNSIKSMIQLGAPGGSQLTAYVLVLERGKGNNYYHTDVIDRYIPKYQKTLNPSNMPGYYQTDIAAKLMLNKNIGNIVYNNTSKIFKSLAQLNSATPSGSLHETYTYVNRAIDYNNGYAPIDPMKYGYNLEAIKPDYLIYSYNRTFRRPNAYRPSTTTNLIDKAAIDGALWYDNMVGDKTNEENHHIFKLSSFVDLSNVYSTDTGTPIDYNKLLASYSMPNSLVIAGKNIKRGSELCYDLPKATTPTDVIINTTVIDKFTPSGSKGYGHKNKARFTYIASDKGSDVQRINFNKTEPISRDAIKDIHKRTWSISQSQDLMMFKSEDPSWIYEFIVYNIKSNPSLSGYMNIVNSVNSYNAFITFVKSAYGPDLADVVNTLNKIVPRFEAILRTDVVNLNPSAYETHNLTIASGSTSSSFYVSKRVNVSTFSDIFNTFKNAEIKSTHLTPMWLQFAVVNNDIAMVYINASKEVLLSDEDTICAHTLPYIDNTTSEDTWKYVAYRLFDLDTKPGDELSCTFELYTKRYIKMPDIDTSIPYAYTEFDPWSLEYRFDENYTKTFDVTKTKIRVNYTQEMVTSGYYSRWFTTINDVQVNDMSDELGVNYGRIRDCFVDYSEDGNTIGGEGAHYSSHIIKLVNDEDRIPNSTNLSRSIIIDKDYGNGFVFRETTPIHRYIPYNNSIKFTSPVNSVNIAYKYLAEGKTPWTKTDTSGANTYASEVIGGTPAPFFSQMIFTKKGYNIDYERISNTLVNPLDFKYIQNYGIRMLNLRAIRAKINIDNLNNAQDLVRVLSILLGFPLSYVNNAGLAENKSNLREMAPSLALLSKYDTSKFNIDMDKKKLYTKVKETPAGGYSIFRAVALIAGQNSTNVPDYIIHPSDDVITDDEFNASQDTAIIDQELKPDLNELIKPCQNVVDILAINKNGLDVKILVKSQAWYKIYSVVDFTKTSYITIFTPNADLENEYVLELKYTLPTETSTIKIGSWFVDFDLSRPNNVNIVHSDDYDIIKDRYSSSIKEAIPEGFIRLGSDPNFKLGKTPIPTGLYLKVNSVYTDINSDTETINVALYYPMFRHRDFVGVKGLDVYHDGSLYHVRATASKEVILPNGSIFIPNEHLEFTTTILNTKVNSKILRLY